MATKDYVSIDKVENRQWISLGIFSVIACCAIGFAIYTFNSRISVLEEKTNNLQKTLELYEQKNKELKQENEKYIKSLLAINSDAAYSVKLGE